MPETESGNKYLITTICIVSKFPEAIPVPDITSISVTVALLQIFSRFGLQSDVQRDNGTPFNSYLTTEFFGRFGIKISNISVSHPQSNPVERYHRSFKKLLRALCLETGENWEIHLPMALFALRTATHESLGYSPAELVHGRNLRTPGTLLYEKWVDGEEHESLVTVTEHVFEIINRLQKSQELTAECQEKQEKRKLWYDKRAVKREFKKGDKVLIFATSKANKLSAQWDGPKTVLSETGSDKLNFV